MKLNIIHTDTLLQILQLEAGECFLYSERVYMKTNSKDPNAIDIKSGVLRTFTPTMHVLPLDIIAINSHKE